MTGIRCSTVKVLAIAIACFFSPGHFPSTEVAAAAPVAGPMEVTPDSSRILSFSGDPGGPFAPLSVTYTVKNRGTLAMDWSVTKSRPWVNLSTEGGTLGAGEEAPVTVSVSEIGEQLPASGHIDELVFTNLTSNTFIKISGKIATGSAIRFVTLNVIRSGESLTQGFGATTAGGSWGTVYHVTTLDDNGDDTNPLPGSIRDALAQGDRYIVFDIGGTIRLKDFLYVRGGNITIDGLSAPAPGITLKDYSLILRGKKGAHDVIVRGIRIRDIIPVQSGDSQYDGAQVFQGAFNIVFDGVSVHGADDGSIDITGDSHDVTVAWTVLARPKGSQKNMLIKYHPSRVSLHHNLFVNAKQRNPQVAIDKKAPPATETTVDIRNNLIWNFKKGMLIKMGALGNVVNNYYSKASKAISVRPKRNAYVSGNFTPTSKRDINRVGKRASPFPAPFVEITDAKTAACQVLNGAGVRPLDDVDLTNFAAIDVPGCTPGADPPSVSIMAPSTESIVTGLVTVSAAAEGDSGIAGVRFFLDELALGEEITTPPYAITWDTASTLNGAHSLHARVKDAFGNRAVSAGLNVTVENSN